MIDRNDAPDGMVAVRMREDCSKCDYYKEFKDADDGRCPYYSRCSVGKRKDGESVCFKKRENFEKMLIKEIKDFYQVDCVNVYKDVNAIDIRAYSWERNE